MYDRWRFGVSTPTQYALGFSRFCVSKLALGSDFCEYSSGMDPCRVDTYSVKLASFAVPETPSATSTLVHAFVANRLDYCCSLYAGLPACRLGSLDRVLRSAARLIGG